MAEYKATYKIVVTSTEADNELSIAALSSFLKNALL